MPSATAAVAGPLVPTNERSPILLVCTGVITLILLVAAAASVEGSPLIGAGLVGLIAASATALCAQHRIRQSEARLLAAVQASDALDRANADLRRFAFAVAHDLQAPLVSTKGMLNMAKDVASSGELEEVIHLLDRAAHTTRRMDGVISGMLDLATGDAAPSSQLVDLSDVLADSLDDLSPSIERLGFRMQFPKSLGRVRGDARYIQQVFDNLMGNAVKYVRPSDPNTAPTVTIKATRLRHSIRVTIADNGPGIPHSRREGLLTRNLQSGERAPRMSGPRSVSGANFGLGLSLAREAMETCGGTLSIRTSPMGGTEFALDFAADPCVTPDQPPTSQVTVTPHTVRADRGSFSSRTILTTG